MEYVMRCIYYQPLYYEIDPTVDQGTCENDCDTICEDDMECLDLCVVGMCKLDEVTAALSLDNKDPCLEYYEGLEYDESDDTKSIVCARCKFGSIRHFHMEGKDEPVEVDCGYLENTVDD